MQNEKGLLHAWNKNKYLPTGSKKNLHEKDYFSEPIGRYFVLFLTINSTNIDFFL